MSKRRNKKRRKKEKDIVVVAIVLFAIGFMSLCQHMGVIRLGYVLGKEKAIHKELSNLNRSLYFEKASLKSPRYLNKVACSNLGLNVGAEVQLRKISVVSPLKGVKNKNRIANWIRLFRLNSKAIARPSKK